MSNTIQNEERKMTRNVVLDRKNGKLKISLLDGYMINNIIIKSMSYIGIVTMGENNNEQPDKKFGGKELKISIMFCIKMQDVLVMVFGAKGNDALKGRYWILGRIDVIIG